MIDLTIVNLNSVREFQAGCPTGPAWIGLSSADFPPLGCRD